MRANRSPAHFQVPHQTPHSLTPQLAEAQGDLRAAGEAPGDASPSSHSGASGSSRAPGLKAQGDPRSWAGSVADGFWWLAPTAAQRISSLAVAGTSRHYAAQR